jgi:4-amino-4-deoxy-L-arabinose transferase-like glycosyltransferase
MWIVGASNAAWCHATAGDGEAARACRRDLARGGYHRLTAYVVPRVVLGLLTSALVAALAALAARLLGLPAAAAAGGLVAFEPFFVGQQRFITTDALAADLGAVAAMLFLLHLREGGRRWLVASAVSLGLAAATKVPAVLLLPPMALWIAAVEAGLWPGFARRGARLRAREAALWAAVAAATVFTVWPALWVAPVRTAQSFLADVGRETEAYPHRQDDPRWSFYPRVLAWRLTPLTQAGVLLCAAAAVWPRGRRRQARRGELEAIATLAAGTLVLLRLAGDAGVERYVLPVLPFVALLAGAGWAWLGERIETRWNRGTAAVVGAVAAAQLLVLVPHLPGALTFFNPLLGGAPAARQVLKIGMGEGLDEAAQWLNREPGAESMVVASACSGVFAPYFRGRTVEKTFLEDPAETIEADRLVVYVRQYQMEAMHPVVMAYLESQRPLHVVRLHGLDYAWIYPGPFALPETWRALAASDPGAAH